MALTLPGHHGGPALAGGVPGTVPALVDGVVDTLDRLGIGKAHIAGNSLGGRVALELARRDQALSVVAIAPAAWWPSDRALRRVTRSLRAGVAAARWIAPFADLAVSWPVLCRALGSRTMRFPERCSPADLAGILRAVSGCTVVRDILRSAPSEGVVRDLDRISCPVRLAWPSDDRVLPFATFGAGLAERMPGASLVMLPETGHVPMWADPDLVARAPFPPGGPPVTASIGGVAFERAPGSVKAALAQADVAMYTAKREGKNRYAVAVARAVP